jgi:NAD(P)-dependent dehydrogenase (short-subunit alcohol dehydrogenase family)
VPATIEHTAAAIDAAGGTGIARVCDHRSDAQVFAVAAEIAAAGGMRLLVNSAWGGYERLNAGAWAEWTSPFWEQPIDLFDAMFASGVRVHYVTARACVQMLQDTAGLMVTISMEVGERHDEQHGVAYSAAKAADDRIVEAVAGQLQGQASAIALYPGLVRTEGVMQFAEHLDLAESQSCEGVGRVIAALADDDHHRYTGQRLRVDALARQYGIDPT